MKTLRLLSATIFALASFALAFAADASPVGMWKWKVETPNGDIEASAKLELTEGKLTGTYRSPFGEAKIHDASWKADGSIAFAVEREFDGNKFVVKYAGKLEGDAIRGTIQLPTFDGGEPVKQEWRATRTK